MINLLKHNRLLTVALLLSLLFFIRKGVQYFIIGSNIPLLIIVGLIAVLLIGAQRSIKSTVYIMRIWAVLIILWSLARIFISGVHLTVFPFDEAFHLSNQFGLNGIVLSGPYGRCRHHINWDICGGRITTKSCILTTIKKSKLKENILKPKTNIVRMFLLNLGCLFSQSYRFFRRNVFGCESLSFRIYGDQEGELPIICHLLRITNYRHTNN